VASRFELFSGVGKLLWFLLVGDLLSSEDEVGLDSFGEIQVPDLNFGEEAGNDGVVALGGVVAVDGAETDLEPLDVEGEGGEHDFVVDEEVVAILLVDVNFQTGVLLFLN
jgi:hypothetical protein